MGTNGTSGGATKAVSVTDFLLARIVEDEYEARVCLDQYMRGEGGSTPRWTRQLAECAAMRKILALSDEFAHHESEWDAAYQSGITDAIKGLASVYLDHPDYRQEWGI